MKSVKEKERMITKWREKISIEHQHFTAIFVGAVIIYAELMIHQLTNNYDGLWEGSFHNAGECELSSGRWFWYYISRLRFGTSADPYTSLITLALMTMGLLLLFDLLEIKNKYLMILSGLLFISHPAICFELSYRFMSPTCGVAFFLSILAVWCFEKIAHPVAAILAGSFCVAFSMGAYQPYICCTTVAFLTALLMKLSGDADWKRISHFSGKSIAGMILGGIEYIVILKIHLQANGMDGLSEYQGGSSYSIMNSIRCLPSSVSKIHQIFTLYFKGILYKINRMQGKHIFTLMFIMVLILAVLRFLVIWERSKQKAILFGACIFLYPLAALSVMMIATDANYGLQMACGPALFLAALPCLFWQGEPAQEVNREENAGHAVREKMKKILEKSGKVCRKGFAVWMAVILYGSIWQVIIDQNMMYEGRIATENQVDIVLNKLLQEDLISSEYRYVFLGTPPGSFLYLTDSNYEHTNIYALYGAWFLGRNGAKSWRGVIRNEKGLNLNVVTGEEYAVLSSAEMVKSMPLFPERGSIVLKDDVVYIKISEAY